MQGRQAATRAECPWFFRVFDVSKRLGWRAMDTRRLAVGIAAGRVGFAASFLLAPSRGLRAWAGPAGDTPAGRMLVRSVGGRDLALALGLLDALRGGRGPAATWAWGGALADAFDGVATVLAWRHLRWGGRAVVPLAFVAAAAGAYVAMQVDAGTTAAD